MEKKSLVLLVSFLMVLYIGPSILTPSLMRAPILTEQNTNKDFLVASEPWLFGWDYRKAINIIGSAGAGTNYQVPLNVTWIGYMENDFQDIRFTDDDKTTLLDYWMETFVEGGGGEPGYGYFWVEVKDNLDTNQTIYMYYGNDAVSTTSDGDATFVFYEDWTAEVLGAQWTTIDNDGTISFDDTSATHGSIATFTGDAGASDIYVRTDDDWTKAYATRFRANLELTVAASQYINVGWRDIDGSALAGTQTMAGVQTVTWKDDNGAMDQQVIADGYFDVWATFDCTRDGTNSQWIIDGVEILEGDNSPDELGYNFYIYVRDSEYQAHSDWIIIRKFIEVAPSPSFGEEETAPVPEWVDVGSATFIFHVGWDPTFQFGFDAFFIFLGLIMMPLSTMYMVRGGRKGLSTDKLFYALIIFVMGLALFIGGIMP